MVTFIMYIVSIKTIRLSKFAKKPYRPQQKDYLSSYADHTEREGHRLPTIEQLNITLFMHVCRSSGIVLSFGRTKSPMGSMRSSSSPGLKSCKACLNVLPLPAANLVVIPMSSSVGEDDSVNQCRTPRSSGCSSDNWICVN